MRGLVLEKIKVNEKEFLIIKLLGKGKGGYSYLVSDDKEQYVVKQIHHEPCDYYKFGDKLQSEINDYKRLYKNAFEVIELLARSVISSKRSNNELAEGRTPKTER